MASLLMFLIILVTSTFLDIDEIMNIAYSEVKTCRNKARY